MESKRSCCKPCELTFARCFVTGFLLDEYLILELVGLLGSFGVEELDRCLCEGICVKSVRSYVRFFTQPFRTGGLFSQSGVLASQVFFSEVLPFWS